MSVERVFGDVSHDLWYKAYNTEKEFHVEGRRPSFPPSFPPRSPPKDSHGWSLIPPPNNPSSPLFSSERVSVCVCLSCFSGMVETSEGGNEVVAHLSSSTEFSMRKRWSAAIWSGGSSTSMARWTCASLLLVSQKRTSAVTCTINSKFILFLNEKRRKFC